MENILADLLAFSRPDALNPEWLDVNKLLDSDHQHHTKSYSGAWRQDH